MSFCIRCVLKAEKTALLVRSCSRKRLVIAAGSVLSERPFAVASLKRRRVSSKMLRSMSVRTSISRL
jgi:hypothetical protein